jgi:hypothetical protein
MTVKVIIHNKNNFNYLRYSIVLARQRFNYFELSPFQYICVCVYVCMYVCMYV